MAEKKSTKKAEPKLKDLKLTKPNGNIMYRYQQDIHWVKYYKDKKGWKVEEA